MKKIMLTLALLMSVLCGAKAQNDAMYVYRNDGIIDLIYKNQVEKIEYTKDNSNDMSYDGWKSLKINIGEKSLFYDLSQVDSLVVSAKQPKTYQVRFEDMKDWDDCYTMNVDNTNNFMFVKSSENETCIRFVEYEDQSNFMDFYLDSNNNIYCIVKKDFLYFVEKNANAYGLTKISSEGKIVDTFTIQFSDIKKVKRRASSDIPNLMMDVYSLLSGHRDFQNHNYKELSLSILENAIVKGAKLTGWTSFLTQAGMEIAKQIFVNAALQEYYQGCIPQITSVKNQTINVTIPNVDRINPNYGVYLTIAIRKGSDDVSFTNHDMLLPKTFVSSNSNISINLSDLEIGTYHLLPILSSNYVNVEHPILKNSLISNGPSYTYKYPEVILDDYKQESCDFIDNTYYFTSTVTVKTDQTFGPGYFGVDVDENIGSLYNTLETFTAYCSEETEKKITLKFKLNSNSQSIKNNCIYLTPFVSRGKNKVYGNILKIDFIVPYTCPDSNHPHAIDLGLPSGTKWCCCNVGASVPERTGGYYAWGETSEKSIYTEVSYSYYTGKDNDGDQIYEEDAVRISIGNDISRSSYDVASMRLGRNWHMPSPSEVSELINNCQIDLITHNDRLGLRFLGPNRSCIFIPMGGFFYHNIIDKETRGCYWLSTSDYSGEGLHADMFGFGTNGYGFDAGYRSNGQNVRAVCP